MHAVFEIIAYLLPVYKSSMPSVSLSYAEDVRAVRVRVVRGGLTKAIQNTEIVSIMT